MDIASVANAALSAQSGQQQIAMAAAVMKINAEMEASVLKLVESSQQNINSLANVAAGVGGNLDISV
jgi:hypothetical protein